MSIDIQEKAFEEIAGNKKLSTDSNYTWPLSQVQVAQAVAAGTIAAQHALEAEKGGR